mmetsp:Transcript_95352/g.258816  ORF Transcript_95352/g.258816 Transcript_95352/m.258816 type:complete len:203 (+) Transcript_95352:1530-2138(+)
MYRNMHFQYGGPPALNPDCAGHPELAKDTQLDLFHNSPVPRRGSQGMVANAPMLSHIGYYRAPYDLDREDPERLDQQNGREMHGNRPDQPVVHSRILQVECKREHVQGGSCCKRNLEQQHEPRQRHPVEVPAVDGRQGRPPQQPQDTARQRPLKLHPPHLLLPRGAPAEQHVPRRAPRRRRELARPQGELRRAGVPERHEAR